MPSDPTMPSRAALVYGRTSLVDFRILMAPEDFDAEGISWAVRHIQGTTQGAEDLAKYTRCSVFQDDAHQVIGLTCMADQLSPNCNVDSFDRPLYLFVGWVSHTPFPPLPSMLSLAAGDWSIFRDLYGVVRARWEDTDAGPPERSSYTAVAEPQAFAEPSPATDLQLNMDAGAVMLYPATIAEALWRAAGECTRPTSLCLNLSRSDHAVKGPFLNATALDLQEPRQVRRGPKAPEEPEVLHYPAINVSFDRDKQRAQDARAGKVKGGFGGLVKRVIRSVADELTVFFPDSEPSKPDRWYHDSEPPREPTAAQNEPRAPILPDQPAATPMERRSLEPPDMPSDVQNEMRAPRPPGAPAAVQNAPRDSELRQNLGVAQNELFSPEPGQHPAAPQGEAGPAMLPHNTPLPPAVGGSQESPRPPAEAPILPQGFRYKNSAKEDQEKERYNG